MKMRLFATAFAVGAVVCAPAMAQDEDAVRSGYIGANFAQTEIDVSGADADFDSYGVHAAAFVPLRYDLGAQVNVAYSNGDELDSSLSGSVALVSDIAGGRIAGMVGASEVGDDLMMAYGLQGNAHLANSTLTGGATLVTLDEFDTAFWLVDGGIRYFASENVRIDAGLGYVSGEFGGVDTDGWTISLGGEVQLIDSPVSLFGGYNRIDMEDLDLTADTVSVGVRYNFGGSLLDRDRNGVGFRGLSDLVRIASF